MIVVTGAAGMTGTSLLSRIADRYEFPAIRGIFYLRQPRIKGRNIDYTANCHNLHFWTPTPTLPRWEREHKESADYARLQYTSRLTCVILHRLDVL